MAPADVAPADVAPADVAPANVARAEAALPAAATRAAAASFDPAVEALGDETTAEALDRSRVGRAMAETAAALASAAVSAAVSAAAPRMPRDDSTSDAPVAVAELSIAARDASPGAQADAAPSPFAAPATPAEAAAGDESAAEVYV